MAAVNNEDLLKSISELLKKHESYLSDNPEVFLGIQDRLFDAIGYEENLEKADDNPEGKPKKSSKHGYTDWVAGTEYSPEQQADIEHWMNEGFSHREAERFANAHKPPVDLMSALSHKINPSQPSDRMLDMMREIALDYKRRASTQAGESADPRFNPIKSAAHKSGQAHQDVYGNYANDYKKFLAELDEQDLHPLEYDDAVSQWKQQWHDQNPDARESMIQSAESGSQAFTEAGQARQQELEEGALDLISGGMRGEGASVGEFSEQASGGQAIDAQTAAQMVGGAKGESGYEAGIFKDPATSFRERNPEYVESLKQRLAQKLGQNPEAQERHSAMPQRDRTPRVTSQQPGEVKRFTPEEIEAMYGDQYKVNKPEGGE